MPIKSARKDALDKGNFVDTIFMDLSKAFDILNHDLLIAKPVAYGLFITYNFPATYSQPLKPTFTKNRCK